MEIFLSSKHRNSLQDPTRNPLVSENSCPESHIGVTPIQGFEQEVTDQELAKSWKPISDRKIQVGIAGHGVCGFGAAFHFQTHPNVTVSAVADLDPVKCDE